MRGIRIVACVLAALLISTPAQAGPRGRGSYRFGLAMSIGGLAMGGLGAAAHFSGDAEQADALYRWGGISMDLGATVTCTGTLVSAAGVRRISPNHGMVFGLGGLAGEIYMTPIGYALCGAQMARNHNAVRQAGGWELGNLGLELVPVGRGLGVRGQF
ncbi:MAG: hypothetical protein H6741_07075 [Alphaproteobacteria bacterium]|nr:hypothetical protein [Alphaproteobacteria bacterium]